MTRIEDIFTASRVVGSHPPIDWDPLVESDALQEAGLLDCRVCPITGRIGLLLDMRTSLQYRTGNAGLLVVRGMRLFRWSEEALERDLLNFAIVSSNPSALSKGWRLDCSLFPDGELSVEGIAADFYLLNASEVPESPPDFSERRFDQARQDLPWWDSSCSVVEWSTTSLVPENR
ncbi:hypothetical protein [Streptomyces anulatus]|uniref:Uncharacterized protein n=1 Tax=Streptomyces anulatus TaxID=1892 RepID=A0A7K3R8S9_STRAQ|nr:hypothetical protein [Streptomyces anulatus]NEB98587.1 hypothetical protein [Streptomyces anulatus]NED24580.1 hypothetical protein [Streptomyces anulatus]